jgi:hypothetical protein
MQKVSKRFYKIISLSVLSSFVYLPAANADSVAPEIISVKAVTSEVFVGKKWTEIRFEVVAKDQSTNIKLNKIFIKSTNAQSKNIPCFDAVTLEKTISGELFAHKFSIYCLVPKNTEAPDVRFIQFTATDAGGLSSTYENDIFDTKINFIFGFDPKVVERSQTDAGKLRLVEDCTSYEQQRIGALELYREVAKFPAGNPFEVQYKEGKTAFAKPFNCELGADLLTRVSDYEDSIKRWSIGVTEFIFYSKTLAIDTQQKLILEKTAPLKKTSITCIKGKTSKVIKGVNPKCPAGYKKK